MADESKIAVSIHLVNTDLAEATSFEDIVAEIIDEANQSDGNFFESKLARKDFGKFNVKLFYSYAVYPPKWRGFLEPILDKRSNLANAENISYSYVCFVGLDDNIYAVTGGFGGQKVSRFMIPDFGLEILVRLFDRNSKVVKSIQDRGLTGNVLGQTKFYRGDQRVSDENQFGKIFKQVQADLNKELLKKVFGFSDAELKRNSSVCMAKESFQINKAVAFDTMLNLVEKLAGVMKKKPNFSLNKVEHLSRRKKQNQQLTEKLDFWAMDVLYNECKKGEEPNVDFCHKNFDEFLSADSIEILIDKGKPVEIPLHSSFSQIIRLLKNSGNYYDDDQYLFKASVLDRKIVSYDAEGEKLTSGLVFDHVHGEFFYNDRTYFLLDNEWYRIQPAFIKDLNSECVDILKHAWDTTTLTEPFNINQRESVYNQKYLHQANFYVFDTITPDNIESCDIMRYDNNAIQLIHVKKGFDNSVRDLASQVNIAAKRLQDDLRTGFEYIEKIQRQTTKSKVGDLGKQVFPKNGLASIFKDKSPQQISFCLAFADKSQSNRSLKNHIDKFNSNIAKFSILELRRELFSMGFGFKVIQLTKE